MTLRHRDGRAPRGDAARGTLSGRRRAASRCILAGLLAAALLVQAWPAAALKEERRQEIRRRIEGVKVWQLTRDLGLSEDQAKIFVPAHRDYMQRKEELRAQREEIEVALETLVGGARGPEREITAKLEAMKHIDRQIEANESEFQRKLLRILSPEQQARYELFDKRFNAQLREMIRDIKRGDERAIPEKGR